MKITILGIGSRGDTQPCVALGVGLRARGHQVRVAASRRYAGLASSVGLDFAPITVDPLEIVRSEEGQAMLTGGGGSIGLLMRFKRIVEPIARQIVVDVDTACAGMDAILAPPMAWLGQHAAQRHGIPHAVLHFQPGEPTAEFANLLTGRRSLGRPVNRLSHYVVEQLTWQILRPMTNRLRGSELELPPIRFWGPMRQVRRDKVPVLCAFSSEVVPRPADWPDNVHLTGYWFLDTPTGWTPPSTLSEFLTAGSPPVFVGFGSSALDEPAEVDRIIRAAIHNSGLRAVLQGEVSRPLDGTILTIGDVPHSWLFPQVRAVVHHGGAGTTAAGLRAGAPSVIVCPSFSDQPFWGARVAALGAGPNPIPFKQLTVDRLIAAISQADSARAVAQELGHKLRAEQGVDRACDLIESWW